MSHGFSGVIRISNISDFIEPSQKCVIPLNRKLMEDKNLVGIYAKPSTSRMGLARRTNGVDKKIQVSLSDCLACSGCVTTAETMLIGSQTIDEMLKGLGGHSLSVVTISPQSLCSLAVHFQLSPQSMAIHLSSYFKSLGANYVIDSSFGRLLSRKLCYEELKQVNRRKTNGSSATLFAGACPGFVCYAEKTHGDLLVPLITCVRSPQALMGALVKNYLTKKLNVAPSQTYHVSVMPCYDKKLEASRKDFILAEKDTKEVDCVVTAIELQPLLEQYLVCCDAQNTLSSMTLSSQHSDWLNRFEHGRVLGDGDRETSGGFAEYIVRQLAAETNNVRVEREQKTKDLEVTTVVVEGNEPIRIAKLYGFKNIQNAVQKLKRNRLNLDFVEVMACPTGCANGGGQIRGENTDQRAVITENVIHSYEQLVEDGASEMGIVEEDWRQLEPDYKKNLFTQYRSLRNENNTLLQTNVPSW